MSVVGVSMPMSMRMAPMTMPAVMSSVVVPTIIVTVRVATLEFYTLLRFFFPALPCAFFPVAVLPVIQLAFPSVMMSRRFEWRDSDGEMRRSKKNL